MVAGVACWGVRAAGTELGWEWGEGRPEEEGDGQESVAVRVF